MKLTVISRIAPGYPSDDETEVVVGYDEDARDSARIGVTVRVIGGERATYMYLTPQEATAMAHALLIEAERAIRSLSWAKTSP